MGFDLKPYEKLKVLRLRKNWTQEALARYVGVSQMQVSRMERGQQPDEFIVKRVEKILGCEIWTSYNQNNNLKE